MDDSKFYGLSNYLQSNLQKKSINAMAEGKIPMHAMIFHCG